MSINYYDMEKYNKCLEDIGKLIQKTSGIFHLIERELVRRDKFTTPQSTLMLELLKAFNKELPMNEIIGRMKLEKSSVTRLVDNLLKYGILYRRKDTADKRLVFIGLTEKGIKIATELQEKRLTYYQSIISHLPAGHVREVMNSFDVLLNALEEGLKK